MSDEVYDSSEKPYPIETANQLSDRVAGGRLRNPPVRLVVTEQIKDLEKEIKARKDLLDALDANPGVEGVLDKMRKLHI
jgi:hypothetical protein